MKAFRVIVAIVAISEAFAFISTAQAQVTARRLTRRIAPLTQPAPTNPATRPVAPQGHTPPAAVAPAPAANPGPALQPRPLPAPVRVVPPSVDPEKARAAKDEAARKTLEFQKKRASEGSESAQYELGVRYLKGDGVEKDEATARKWLTESAKNGYGPASKKLEELDRSSATAPTDAKPSEK